MPAVHHQGQLLHWHETECLNYYEMMSLHEVFEVVGSQLTETDVEVLSFLLNETCSVPHPLDPVDWTVEPSADDPDDQGVAPSPQLVKFWRQLKPQGSQRPSVNFKPKSGLELLLELERRGYLSDGNLEPLLQLLRVLTRHDLLHLVSHKKRRTVSPERKGHEYGMKSREVAWASGMGHNCRQADEPVPSFTYQLTTGNPAPAGSTRRRRKKRGNGWSRRPKKQNRQDLVLTFKPVPCQTSCG
uniref:DED domain-containing protein n=1 Tax=Salarias fasciatus TaxID=181472 RepID=A0A672J2F1_SALFA